MEKAVAYIRDVRSELSKVVWPKRYDVVKLTLTVIIISGGIGLYVGGLDFLFTKALSAFAIR